MRGAQGGGRKALCEAPPLWPSTFGEWRVVRCPRGGLISLRGPRSDAAFCVSDADGNLCRSNQLLQVMLTMHRIIISSADLLQKVISLYPLAPGPPAPSGILQKSLAV